MIGFGLLRFAGLMCALLILREMSLITSRNLLFGLDAAIRFFVWCMVGFSLALFVCDSYSYLIGLN